MDFDSSDIDPYTQKLMERAKARNNALNKKIGHGDVDNKLLQSTTRKRPSPLREGNDKCERKDADGKRYCENLTASLDETNDVSRSNVGSGKENRNGSFQAKFQKIAKWHSSEEVDSPPPKPQRLYPDLSDLMDEDSMDITSFVSKPPSKTKSAALSAFYNEIEDEMPTPQMPTKKDEFLKPPAPKCFPTTNSSSNRSEHPVSNSVSSKVELFSKSSNTSSNPSFAKILEKFNKPANFTTNNSVPKVGTSPQSQTPKLTKKLSSGKLSSAAFNANTLSPSQNTHTVSDKRALWDEAIIATLKSQGFVHSPSQSKLQYEFNKVSNNHSSDVLSQTNVTSTKTNKNKSQLITKTAGVPPPPPLPQPNTRVENTVTPRAQNRMMESKLPQKKIQEERTMMVTPCRSPQKKGTPDPSILPLSARVALFEQATNIEAAAAAASRIVTGLSPHKASSPAGAASENQQRIEPSSSKVGTSAGLIKKKLLENADGWKNKDIVAKTAMERKREMESLMNRHSQQVDSEYSSDEENNVSSEHDFESSCLEVSSPADSMESLGLVVEGKNTNKKQISASNLVPKLSLNTSTSTQSSDNTSDFLDEALESTASSSPEVESSFMKTCQKPCGEITIETKCFHQPAPAYVEEYNINTPTSSDSVSLIHTVSICRRQKEEVRLTPIRTIRRQVMPSPSKPKRVESYIFIKERIKELQNEVDAHEITIGQASQALNLCRSTVDFQGSAEQVEGERLLLIYSQKRMASKNEIKRLKTEGTLGNGQQLQDPSTVAGTLCISNVHLYLKKDFLQMTDNGKTGAYVHFFLCLIKSGPQIIATQMLSTLDLSGNTLAFPNLININNLGSDFNVGFEVYGLQTDRQKMYRVRSLNKKEKSKLNLTPKKKLSKQDSRMTTPSSNSSGGPAAVRTTSFALVGSTNINMRTLNRKIWVLENVPRESPLDGNMEMKIQCHSDFSIETNGFLTMFDDVSGFGAWHRRWCTITGTTLSYWKYPDDENKKKPIGSVDLRKCVTAKVGLVSRDVCARANTFMLVTVRPPDENDMDNLVMQTYGSYTEMKHLLSADTKEERVHWCDVLNSLLNNIRTWDPEALRPFDSSDTNHKQFLFNSDKFPLLK